MPDWRALAFRAVTPPGTPLPPIAAAALQAAPSPQHGAWVCVATPLHLRAGMDRVMMTPDAILPLESDEASLLATDFSRVFGGEGIWLWVGRADVLLCVFDRVLAVATHDPELAVGQDVFDLQPQGRDGPRLRRLMSEIELWLFDHPLNRARIAMSRPPVTGLWMWGGGETVAATAPAIGAIGWSAGRDPLFAAWRRETGWPAGSEPGVVVCAEQPGSAAWAAVERTWLEPATAALGAGRLQHLDLSAADRCCRVSRWPHWRLWRRPRPWWEAYGID
jgi:hypothetical protein